MTLPDYRALVLPLLPEGAFLRRDRAGALYVTDAPGRGADGEALATALGEAGFLPTLDGAQARMVPGEALALALEAAWPLPPDAFSRALIRFAGRPIPAQTLALFARGVACAEDRKADVAAFDRALRQAAARALRLGGGGGLYACALARRAALDARNKDENQG